MDIVIRSYYRHRPGRVSIGFKQPSLAQQHFLDECDINHIMLRYRETGFLTDPFQKPTAQLQYGDFSTPFDYQEAQNVIARAQEAFTSLPSHVRERFGNQPYKMLSFLEDEANYDEAVKLGLVAPRQETQPTSQPQIATPAAAPAVTPEGGAPV